MNRTHTYIKSRFWEDAYIEELPPIEKLIFLYFLSCPYNNVLGMFQVSLRKISLQTGVDEKIVTKTIEKFMVDAKVYYIGDWVIIPNHLKHQKLNLNMKRGVVNDFANLPKWLQSLILETIPNHFEPFETISNHFKSFRTLPLNRNRNRNNIYMQSEGKEGLPLNHKDVFNYLKNNDLREKEKPYERIEEYNEKYEVILDKLETISITRPFDTHPNPSEPFETIPNHSKPFETIPKDSKPSYNEFIEEFNKIADRNFKGDKKSKTAFQARLKEGYTMEEFKVAITNLYNDDYHKENNFKWATPEFITRSDKLEMYKNKPKKKEGGMPYHQEIKFNK